MTTGLEQDSDQNPMQAVYFTTGINDTRCTDAPILLIIQGPKDITVDLRVNGANIQLGSTAIFRSNADNTVMDCGVIDGAALVGGKQVIPAGFIASVPLDENRTPMARGRKTPRLKAKTPPLAGAESCRKASSATTRTYQLPTKSL